MSETLVSPGLTTGHAPFVEAARSRGDLYISQPYELYSEENHEAWRTLFGRRSRARFIAYALVATLTAMASEIFLMSRNGG